MEIHWVSNKSSWVLLKKGGVTSFSEWMKMTYAVGLHESKLSHQGYPVQQCSVWFRNCSLADSRQDRGWLCPSGLVGRMLQWQTSPAANLLQTQHQTSEATQMQLGAGGADTHMSTDTHTHIWLSQRISSWQYIISNSCCCLCHIWIKTEKKLCLSYTNTWPVGSFWGCHSQPWS